MGRKKPKRYEARLPAKPKSPQIEPPRPDPGKGIIIPVLLGLALLAAVVATTGPITNNDYGFHLRIGQEIAQSLRPPRADYHSYTAPGAPYPDQEWLTQLVLFGLHSLWGDAGMVVLKGLLIGLTLVLVVVSVRGPVLLKLALAFIVLLLGLHHAYMRPHLLSWVMFGLLMLFIERRINWALLLLLWVWGNSHGSVLLGVGLAGLYFLEEYWQTRNRKFLIWAAGCALVPLVNPYGIQMYTMFFHIKAHATFVGEWKPFTPETAAFWLVVVTIGLAVIGLLRAKPFNPFDAIRVGVLGILAFQSSRSGVVAAICLAPLIGRWYGPVISRWSPRIHRLAAAVLTAAVFLVLGLRVYQGKALRFELDYEHLPVGAVQFLKAHQLTGPVFNDYNFGGYFLWQAWPDYPVFVDGRIEVYKGRVLDEYLAVSKAQPGWEQIVEKYGITLFVVRPEREIARLLLNHKDWDMVYFDYNSMIFVRHDLFPELKRLYVVSPYGHRDRNRVDQAIEEISYLLAENPQFFGGYKILAFLLYRRGDYPGARDALLRYLELRPQGIRVKETKSLITGLIEKGAWKE